MTHEGNEAPRLIGGRYRLGACIGRGGMGSVWRAEHVTLGAPVAVKLVDPGLLDPGATSSVEVVERFLREAQAAAAIRSPHVVQILDHGLDEGTPFMVLEQLEGEGLDRRLARERVLDIAETSRIVTHVARALSRAHEAGIVHRDLKPSNVFLVDNQDEEIAKVLDFGLAKMARASLAVARSELTATGRVIGTPAYMSPEQAQGTADWRADLYALAVIAFECVCGRVPFEEPRVLQLLMQICTQPLPVPSEIAPVCPGFDAWFAKAAARDPARRFPSAKAMADALRALVGETSPPHRAGSGRVAPGAASVGAGAGFPGRRGLTIAVGSGALAGLIAISAWAASARRAPPPATAPVELVARPAEAAAQTSPSPATELPTGPVVTPSAEPGSASGASSTAAQPGRTERVTPKAARPGQRRPPPVRAGGDPFDRQ
jgi:eukaryotic-like serine/threonine-protein kinase